MKRIFLAAGLIQTICLFSCSKPYNDSATSVAYPAGLSTYSSLDTIFTMLQVPSKFVTFNASVGGSFYGSSGTRYVFPAGCFQDAGGNVVTGIVQVEAKELLNKGDMIFTKALPICNNEPLFSGGEIYTHVTQSGQQLYMRPGYTYQANIPQGKTPLPGLSFFHGTQVTDPVNNVIWKPGDTLSTGSVVYNGDTISIISDSLHWCNADRFMSIQDYQNFKVILNVAGSLALPSSDVHSYTLYDNYKGIWTLGLIGSFSNGVYTELHVPSIPVHFVSYCIINGKFYGGVTAATPVTGGNYTILLTQVDPVAFKGQLNNLTN